MKYTDLPSKWQIEAVKTGLNKLNQFGEEISKEHGSKPVIYTEKDEELKEYLEFTLFEIKTDEVTGEEYLFEEYI